MLYSGIHNWQGDDAVKQVLVFGSFPAQKRFESEFAEQVQQKGLEKASDTNLGAVFKLRAVLNSDNRWDALVRCGVTGVVIAELFNDFGTFESALAAAHQKMQEIAMHNN